MRAKWESRSDADRHGRLLVVGDGPESNSCPAPAKEPAHDGNDPRGEAGRHELFSRDQEAVHGDGRGRDGKWNRVRDSLEQQGGRAAHQGAEAEGDHDERDQRLADQWAQDQPAEGEGQRHHPQAGGTERPHGAESQRVESGRHQPGADHGPFAERKVDHPGGLVHDDEGEGDEGIDGPGQRPVHQEGHEEDEVSVEAVDWRHVSQARMVSPLPVDVDRVWYRMPPAARILSCG